MELIERRSCHATGVDRTIEIFASPTDEEGKEAADLRHGPREAAGCQIRAPLLFYANRLANRPPVSALHGTTSKLTNIRGLMGGCGANFVQRSAGRDGCEWSSAMCIHG